MRGRALRKNHMARSKVKSNMIYWSGPYNLVLPLINLIVIKNIFILKRFLYWTINFKKLAPPTVRWACHALPCGALVLISRNCIKTSALTFKTSEQCQSMKTFFLVVKPLDIKIHEYSMKTVHIKKRLAKPHANKP